MTISPRPARWFALVVLTAVLAFGCKKKSEPDPIFDPPPGMMPVSPVVFDSEGLPMGYDLDSILTRLNFRFQRNEEHPYIIETMNLRNLKKPGFTRGAEVFAAYRGHAGNPAAPPRPGSIGHTAWLELLFWTTKDETPEVCRMLKAERIEDRQSDLFGKLTQFKDPRCAETVAPYLAVPARRLGAELLLRKLDSTAEPFVLPYLGASYDRDTRVAAMQVIVDIGTVTGARIIETMTRDTDISLNGHAKGAFEKLSRKFGIEEDLMAVLAALKSAILASNVVAIQDNSDKLDKAYQPDHPKRAEIFKRLVEYSALPDPKNYAKRATIVGALKWSNADDIGAVCGLLTSTGGESVVFLKLKEYKNPKCADAVAAYLTNPLKSDEAAAVLKAIGGPAETAMMRYASRAYSNGAPIPVGTRSAAIELLGDIGTRDCVPVLQQLTTDPTVQPVASKALMKVGARLQGR